MTDSNEDRTVAFGEFSAKDGNAPIGPSAAMLNAPRARLTCLDASQIEGALPGNGVIHLVAGAEQTVGRGETCTYPIPSRKLSRQHARVFAGVGVWGVEDLNSTNGIQVNRQKVKNAWLKHDDEVKFGPIPFKFELERPDVGAGGPSSASFSASADDGDSEHTMMAGSSGAANAIIAAARKAEDAPQQASLVPPPRPAAAAAAAAPAKSGGGKGGLFAVLALVVIGVGVGGFFYYPTFQRESKIKAVVEMAQTLPANADGVRVDAVLKETKEVLDQNKGNPALSGAYAKVLFQRFEGGYIAKVKAASEAPAFGDAAWKAVQFEIEALKNELKAIDKAVVEAAVAAKHDVKKEELVQVMELVEFLEGLTKHRIFARKNAQVGLVATPAIIRELKELDEFKDSYKNLRRKLNSILTVDHKTLYTLVQDVETKDRVVIDGWRDAKP